MPRRVQGCDTRSRCDMAFSSIPEWAKAASLVAAGAGGALVVQRVLHALRGASDGGSGTTAAGALAPADRVPKRLLVLHGYGMDKRGYEHVERFGTTTLAGYDARINAFAGEIGVSVTITQSNVQAVLAALVKTAKADGYDGIVVNPARFLVDGVELAAALAGCGLPVAEVHYSNPLRRHKTSVVAKAATCAVFGFGVESYTMAMRALADGTLP